MKDIENNTPLITELSTQEEEQINGGIGGFESFFFQQTEIDSFAEDNLSFSNGKGTNLSTSSKAGYRFRQITFGFTSFFFGGKNGNRNNPLLMLFSLFRGL